MILTYSKELSIIIKFIIQLMMPTTNSPTKYGKLVGHYPLVQLSSKLQLPFANLLLVSARSTKKARKSESSKVITAPIHQKTVISGRTDNDISTEENTHLRQFSKLRVSVMNERKKKKIESFNSSLCSIYDRNITKSQSFMLKKDFESAFKKMIVKKQISSKEKQLKASQELWNSMKLRKEEEVSELIRGNQSRVGASNFSQVLHNRNSSEKKLNNMTTNSYYNNKDAISAAPQFSRFYLTGHQFQKPKTPFIRFRDR
jgi:hypothetical protein